MGCKEGAWKENASLESIISHDRVTAPLLALCRDNGARKIPNQDYSLE